MGGDLRYVTEEDYTSFGGRQKRKEAWDVKTGWLGKQIYSNFNITYKSAHTVFSHGDLEPEWARLGVDTLNFMAREAIWNGQFRAPIFQGDGGLGMRRFLIVYVASDLGSYSLCLVFYFPPHEIGPIWSRGHATEEGGEAATCKRIEAVKKALGVRTCLGSTYTEIGSVICSSYNTNMIHFLSFSQVNRLISGHTPQYRTGKILSICNGSYMVIDVGISKYYGALETKIVWNWAIETICACKKLTFSSFMHLGGHLAALEIIEHNDGTQSVYALYPGGKRMV